MPQDIRISPDGKIFYVADMLADGVFLIDGDSFSEVGFVPQASELMVFTLAVTGLSFTCPIVARMTFMARATGPEA
jgi:DNA-binding beta-propeller fold protein YncE